MSVCLHSYLFHQRIETFRKMKPHRDYNRNKTLSENLKVGRTSTAGIMACANHFKRVETAIWYNIKNAPTFFNE